MTALDRGPPAISEAEDLNPEFSVKCEGDDAPDKSTSGRMSMDAVDLLRSAMSSLGLTPGLCEGPPEDEEKEDNELSLYAMLAEFCRPSKDESWSFDDDASGEGRCIDGEVLEELTEVWGMNVELLKEFAARKMEEGESWKDDAIASKFRSGSGVARYIARWGRGEVGSMSEVVVAMGPRISPGISKKLMLDKHKGVKMKGKGALLCEEAERKDTVALVAWDQEEFVEQWNR
ncbi:hypothetical protein BC829DRAFT_413986 [Chytridium lagenaria]|nr:hypothetical protein BC829DRAFT_413986 [Chytridium lagenaria]